MGRRVSLGSVGSALGVVGKGWVSGVRPGSRRVRSGSMGSLRCALVVVGIVRGRLVQWGTPWGSSGSCGVAWISALCPVLRWVRSGSLGLVGCSLGCGRVLSWSLD